MSLTREGTRLDESAHDYDWAAVSDAYDRIFDLPESEQTRAVEALPDGPVRDGVGALVAAIERADHTGLLERLRPAKAGDTPAPPARGRRWRGERPASAGPFALLQEVGQGGMGVVYRAEDRSNGQRAAVKVLMTDSEDAEARFALEARLLAVLDHSSIPKLLRQGETAAGQPYIAMEYVEGSPVTEFADARSLGTAERLALFELACNAVRHAHLKLVAHLDVKPSNVLGYDGPDGERRIALIDFGASKSLSGLGDGSGWDAAGLTDGRLRPGTPAYAAPEQARPKGEGRAQTMAADVFSLGVLLYELLTSARPVDAGVPPSRATSLGVSAQQAWAIDMLVARAIDPDPEARHPSADALLTDVRRAQQSRGPAGARAPWTARTRWFVVRNRLSLAVAATVVLGAVGGLTLLHDRWSTSRREAESDLAVLVSEFLRAVPSQDADGLLMPAAETIQHGLERQPSLEADLSLAVADALVARGQCDQAAPIYGRATLLRTQTAPDHPVVVAGLRGQARCAAGRFGASPEEDVRRAVATAEEALSVARSRYGARSVVAAAIETDLALYHAALGEFDAGGDLLAWAEATLEGLGGLEEAYRLQNVHRQTGTRIVVFPDVEGPRGVALARSRTQAAFATLLHARGDYAGRSRAVAPRRPAVHRAEPVLRAEQRAVGRVGRDCGVQLRRRIGRAGAPRPARRGAGERRTRRDTAREEVWSRGRSDRPEHRRRVRRSPGPPAGRAARLRGVVHEAESVGDGATLAAALQAYARALYEAGDRAAAASVLGRVVSIGAAETCTLALAYTGLSRIALDSRDRAQALEHAEEALRAAHALPAAPGVRLGVLLGAASVRAEALLQSGRAADAVGVLDPVVGIVRAAPTGVVRPEVREEAERLLRAAYAGV